MKDKSAKILQDSYDQISKDRDNLIKSLGDIINKINVLNTQKTTTQAAIDILTSTLNDLKSDIDDSKK